MKAVRSREQCATTGVGASTCEQYFSIPEEFVPAVKAWMNEEPQQACQAKTASSVVYVRDGKEGLETILTYRPGFSPLGTVAFPGGLCIADDTERIAWLGPTEDAWRDAFKHDDRVAAHSAVVGAIRESFEEVGILLAGPDEQNTVEVSSDGLDLMAAREAVAAGDKTFADYIDKRGIKLRTDLLRPIVRWQSPDFRHKRYDIHYFACAAPVGQNPKLLASKGVWGDWVNVKELLAHQETSQLGDTIDQPETRGKTLKELLTPGTFCALEDLSHASTTVAYLAKKRAVAVKKADVVVKDGQYMLRFTAPTKAGMREKCSL